MMGATAAFATTWRRRVPPIAIVPIAYVVLAVASSFVIRLKEPRYLIAIVPMIALSIALLVDWDDVWTAIRRSPRQGPTGPDRPPVTMAP
jgi:hypothetical protein